VALFRGGLFSSFSSFLCLRGCGLIFWAVENRMHQGHLEKNAMKGYCKASGTVTGRIQLRVASRESMVSKKSLKEKKTPGCRTERAESSLDGLSPEGLERMGRLG